METLARAAKSSARSTVHLHARGDAGLLARDRGRECGSPPHAWRRFNNIRTWNSCASVHLHARGDAFICSDIINCNCGSPPRAWRRSNVAECIRPLRRFTSTRVETLRAAYTGRSKATVHLHARGDASSRPFNSGVGRGSPPRAWRRSEHPCDLIPRSRFTSTRVETLPSIRAEFVHVSVHLHARGDAFFDSFEDVDSIGSPPRAWRRLVFLGIKGSVARFTSTRVETLCRLASRAVILSVHLHARGDACLCLVGIGGGLGSPPRAWRRLHRSTAAPFLPRFTSTRVETLSIGRRFVCGTSVHLHARGDATEKVQ